MSKPTLHTYFFPDPFGTGESVSVEAEGMETALQQLENKQPKPMTDAEKYGIHVVEDALQEAVSDKEQE